MSTADHQIELIAQCGKCSVLEKMKVHRTKCTALVKNIVAVSLLEDLVEELRSTKFSSLIVKSTNVSVTKNLCFCVRYYFEKANAIVTSFLALIEVILITGDDLFNKIKFFFFSEHDID